MLVILHILAQAGLIVRVLLRAHRNPASRIAWVVVIAALPVVGILAYVLFGEVNIGRRRIERLSQVLAELPDVAQAAGADAANLRPEIPERYRPLFRVGHSISGFEPVGGNHGRLLADSNATIDAMVADIDAATDHVHLLFYIWLPDDNGLQGGRGAEAGRRARRHLPRHGRRPGLARHDPLRALAGDARRRGPPGARPCRSAIPCCDRCRGASTCATTARSW